MKARETLLKIRDQLGDSISSWNQKSPSRCYMEVPPEVIRETTTLLSKDLGARFQTASAVDLPDAIEILYHWAFDKQDLVISVRTRVNRMDPNIDSISDISVAAEWIEREIWELLGINFKGHPDMCHLLLDKNWPEGKYPLRRDFRGLEE